MRRILLVGWMAVGMVIVGLTGSAPGAESSREATTVPSVRVMSGMYYAPACGCPSYGLMAPGCCEYPPSRCDHVWDGYCNERCCWGCGACRSWPWFWAPTVRYSPGGCRAECHVAPK